MDSPKLEPGAIKSTLQILDIIFLVLFSLEAAIKIIVHGFLFAGPQSYIRNPWNMLDFLIVLVGVAL